MELAGTSRKHSRSRPVVWRQQLATQPLLQNMLLQFVQSYNGVDFAIDLNQGLATAESVLTQDPATQNEIIVLTSSEAYDPNGADLAATSAETNAGADIDVLYIEAGFYINEASLGSIDSDTTVDIDTTGNFGLSQLIDPASWIYLPTLKEFHHHLGRRRSRGSRRFVAHRKA